VKALFFLVSWYILFVLCWPLAVLALVVWPIVWLISIPMKLIGISIGAVLALCWRCAGAVLPLVKTILFLPVRMHGNRG
jgi:hypothetical protein